MLLRACFGCRQGRQLPGAPDLQGGQRKWLSWTCCLFCLCWRRLEEFFCLHPLDANIRAAEGLLPHLAASDGCPVDSVPGGRVPRLLHWASLLKLQSGLICLIGLGYNPLLLPDEYRELFSAIAFMAQGQSFQSGVRSKSTPPLGRGCVEGRQSALAKDDFPVMGP